MRTKYKYIILLALAMILFTGCIFGKKNGSVLVKMELADGTPLQGIEVTLANDKTSVKGKTDNKGAVKLDVVQGEYTLSANIGLLDKSEHKITQKVVVKADDVTNVTIKDEVLSLVTVEVVQTTTGNPIWKSTLTVVNEEKSYQFATDTTGKVFFYAKAGTYQLKAEALSVKSDAKELVITSGSSAEIKLSVQAIYTQDFATNVMPDDFTIVEGSWVVEDGRLIGDSPTNATQTSIVFGPFTSDLVYSADIAFISVVNESRWCSIFFRAPLTGEPPYHMFTIRQNAALANGTELAFRKPDGAWDVRRKTPYKKVMTIGETFNVKVAVTGNIFLYYINDELQFAAKEEPYSNEGIFGFHVNGSKVAFDNIKIEPYDKTQYAGDEAIAK